MDAAEIAGVLGGTAGLITAVVGIFATLGKIRQERAETDWKIREGRRDARRLAAEESEKALKGIAAANAELRKHINSQNEERKRQHDRHRREQQQLAQRLTDQGTQITDLNTRMTDIQRRYRAAIGHIADRERAIVVSWERRPDSVPEVPEDLMKEILEEDPSLRLIMYQEPSDSGEENHRIRDPTDEDTED